MHGPVGLFDDDKDKDASDDEDNNGDGEIDIEKLRAYELSRLRQVILNSLLNSLGLFRNKYNFTTNRQDNYSRMESTLL